MKHIYVAHQQWIMCAAVLVVVVVMFATCPRVVHGAGDTEHAYRAEANTGSGTETTGESEGCTDDSDAQSCHRLEQDEDRDVIPRTDQNSSVIEWDPKGYVMFCPCMGRFGNQGEHYLGALAFAKALDRTMVLPPFRTFEHASFGKLFQFEVVRKFHRAILMEDFMEHLAPTYWPPGKRSGYCHLPEKSEMACTMKQGNPFGPFWDHFSIDFDDCIRHQIHGYADISNPKSMKSTKQAWDARFPPQEHPVIALRGSPGSYPMLAGNRQIQKYLKWNPNFFADAGKYIKETFRGEGFVGIHLRNGIDWEKACGHADGLTRFMASPQCLEKTPDLTVTKELCLPSLNHILELTSEVFKKVQAKHLYIATDKQPYTGDFQRLLQPQGVTVHYLKPDLAEMDLMILGQADFFIGNCISSFTSFVKRERDVNGKPSIFWGQELKL